MTPGGWEDRPRGRKNRPDGEPSSSSERSHSRWKFWHKDKPSEEASSSSERSHSRWKFWRRQGLDGSSSAQPASLGHEPGSEIITNERPSSSQVVDEARSPSAPPSVHEPAAAVVEPAAAVVEPAAAVVEPAAPSGPYVTNGSASPEDCEAAAATSESLWDQAYEALRKEKPEVVQAYEELLFKVSPYLANAPPTTDLNDVLSTASNDLAGATPTSNTKTARREAQIVVDPQKMMADIIDSGQKHMEGKQIAFKIGQQKFVLQDQIQHVVAGIQLGKDWIDGAVQASPLAGAAWAGICLLLPLLTNPSEVQAANEEGLAYVNQKIRYYTSELVK